MRLILRFAAALLAVLPAAPAAAQQTPPPPTDTEEIVVTGRAFDEQVRDFVDALTPARPHETVARFEGGVCPATRGLPAAQNDMVTARLRVVAAAAGIRVEREGCVPNALLVVTRDKGPFIRALAEARPWFFGDLTPLQIRRLARSPGPAAAWQLRGLVDSDGQPVYFDAVSGYYLNRTTAPASRGRPEGRWVFEGTALVVERRALDGLDVTQLADFAAMRLFARTDPTRLAAGAPTILNILETPMGSAVPLTLTEWDLAFLRGLYASPAGQFAAAQRGVIARDMRAALREEEADE